VAVAERLDGIAIGGYPEHGFQSGALRRPLVDDIEGEVEGIWALELVGNWVRPVGQNDEMLGDRAFCSYSIVILYYPVGSAEASSGYCLDHVDTIPGCTGLKCMWHPGLGNPWFLSDRTESEGLEWDLMPATRAPSDLVQSCCAIYYRLADSDPLEYQCTPVPEVKGHC
jgi:hypothetical protein